VPATLLAVDDSVTMRKVLEMTFAGEEFRVVTADSADAALALVKSENPSLVLSDITLSGKTGYDLCTAIKRDNPGLPVLLLSSKLNPYDKGRGQAAQADDFIDKPFDTQKLIDKVSSLLSGEKKPAATQGAPKAAATPYRAPATLGATLVGQGAPPKPQPFKAPPGVGPAAGRQAQPTNLRATADFAARPIGRGPTSPSARAPSPPATTATASPAPAAVKPKPAAPARPTPQAAPPAAAARPAATPPTPAVAAKAAIDGDLTTKLGNLGLTIEQIDGVLALSNEVVERVVWEVVPVLAETIIKEELKRLTEES